MYGDLSGLPFDVNNYNSNDAQNEQASADWRTGGSTLNNVLNYDSKISELMIALLEYYGYTMPPTPANGTFPTQWVEEPTLDDYWKAVVSGFQGVRLYIRRR